MLTSLERFQSAERFPALDGLRALAVLFVVGFHASVPGDRFFTEGWYGVQLFFALSGFLITMLLLRERRRTGRISLGGFYTRRTARIFPAYYAVLALYVVLTWRLERGTAAGATFFANLPVFATYLSNWFIHASPGDGRVIFYFAWSLAVEEQFYLVWPSIMRWTRGLLVPLGLALVAAAAHPYFTSIGFGCALALLADNKRAAPAVVRTLSHPLALPLGLLGVLAVLLVGGHWPAPVQAAIATVTVGAAATHADSLAGRALSMRWLRYIGGVSYGVYLLHMLSLHAASSILPGRGYLTALLGAVIAIAAASVSFYAFERPIQRWARSERRRKAPERELQPAPVLSPALPAPSDATLRAEM